MASCSVCGTDNTTQPVHPDSVAPWELKQCTNCSMLYLENPPAYEVLEEELAWERTYAQETVTRKQRNPVLYALGRAPKAAVQAVLKRDKLRALAEQYIAPGPVLDVGCGGGAMLARLPRQYVPCGIEISKELATMARNTFTPRGGFVVQADALRGLQQMEAGYFTGIVMTSFLEHETNAREVLEATRRVMSPGAGLIVKVPNYASWNRTLRGHKWCGFRFPDHVNYFTPVLLKRLLETTGFRIVRFNLGDRMPTSDTMWLVAEVRS
ncbi:MAG TPA: class I SAM-dependent methyltransferase [Granulicella sp.]